MTRYLAGSADTTQTVEKYLNFKLECSKCGTITLDIPDNAVESTSINCSRCHGYLGMWGDLQDDFYNQIGNGVFEVKDGRFKRR